MASGGVSDSGYTGTLDVTGSTDRFNAAAFLIDQISSGNWTITLAQVKAVTSSGAVAAPGTVDIQPLVNQLDGQGNATPHGIIHKVPYVRLQGGGNAIICDPVVGDIGVMLCAMRDISSVVSTQKVGNPGSRRQMSPSDSIFVGGLLGQSAPTQYLQFNSDGVTLAIPNGISVALTSSALTLSFGTFASLAIANGTVTISIGGTPIFVVNNTGVVVEGNIQATGGLLLGGLISAHNGTEYAQNITTLGTVTGSEVMAGGIPLSTHVHPGVEPGPDDTGTPLP